MKFQISDKALRNLKKSSKGNRQSSQRIAGTLAQYIQPHAIEIEEVLLGTLMLDNASIRSVEHILIPELFFKPEHQYIFQTISFLRAKDLPFDIVMVSSELQKMGILDNAGGNWYITHLTSQVSSSANIAFHAGVLFQKYILRKLIGTAEELIADALKDTADAFGVSEWAQEEFERINSLTDHLIETDAVSAVEQTIKEVISNNQVNTKGFYSIGISGIDELIGLCPNELLLIGGPAGAGKTRFVIAIMESLLRTYENVSIMWFTFEDPKEKIIRCFASINMKLREDIIRGKKGKMSQNQIDEFLQYMKVFEQYDINFIEDSKHIRQVGVLFRSFCKTRPDRLNICIIDNLLLLEDDSQDRDDLIAKELNRIRKSTHGLILPIHHFNDEQMAKEMLKYAYRPRIVHLKGRESYRRACTQILLINKPGNYADLISEYKGLEDILKHLFIIDIAKNRDGTSNDDNQTLIRLWSNLDYLIFRDI